MPEIRELESFEDFEDAIHNGPTKDCFKTPVCLLMSRLNGRLMSRLHGRASMVPAMTQTLWVPKN